MSEETDWLPPLILIEDYDGDWGKYLEALYYIFGETFIKNKPVFRSQRVGHKRHPLEKGKEVTFWHLISDGKGEDTREIHFDRCKRIRWPKPIIEAFDSQQIKLWTESRNGEPRHHIALLDFSYLVVLAERSGYVIIWTAFYLEQNHRRRKLKRRWERFKKAEAAPEGTAS